MANRTLNQDQQLTFVKKQVLLYPVISVGGAGAVTLKKRQFTAMGATNVAASSSLISAPTTGVGYVVGDGAGVRSIVRNSAGDWTLTLSDPYQYLMGVSLLGIQNSGGTNANAIDGISINSTTTNVATNTSVGSGGVLRIVLFANSTATDPASGDTVYLQIILGDSTAP